MKKPKHLHSPFETWRIAYEEWRKMEASNVPRSDPKWLKADATRQFAHRNWMGTHH